MRSYILTRSKQTNFLLFKYEPPNQQLSILDSECKFEQSIKAPNGKNDFVHKLGDNDTLYVVKGGYIDDEEIKYTGNHVAVPRFYFIALLLYQNGQYTQGMAYYVNQFDYDSSSTIKSYAMSIDKLEEKTHIDFFHNLPPDIESEVEAKYDEKAWFQ
ncbi:DNA/RNA non-specific endonuclease [Bacteroides ovatus]|nr:DNA/RNA non-specific endonuclease [Bacteroides ovatus]